jgi:hypothetical protein
MTRVQQLSADLEQSHAHVEVCTARPSSLFVPPSIPVHDDDEQKIPIFPSGGSVLPLRRFAPCRRPVTRMESLSGGGRCVRGAVPHAAGSHSRPPH